MSCENIVWKAYSKSIIQAHNKYVFKLQTKVSDKYKRRPYYLGCKYWDSLPQMTHKSPNCQICEKENS